MKTMKRIVAVLFVLMLAVGAAEILHIGYSQRQTAALGLANKELGMTHAACINYLCEMID